MTIWSWRRTVGLVATLTLATGCARKNSVETVADNQPTSATTPSAGAPNGSRGPSSDSIANEEARRRAERAARIHATIAERILFGYDQSVLSDDARQILQAKVEVLRETPDLRIRIEGHADERGSDQYNAALGQQRAAAVRRYLTGFGIAESRLDIVSFGEHRPLCQSEGESCWAQNRRAEFQIISDF